MEALFAAIVFEAEYCYLELDSEYVLNTWNGEQPSREAFWWDAHCDGGPDFCQSCKYDNGCPWSQANPYYTGDSAHC